MVGALLERVVPQYCVRLLVADTERLEALMTTGVTTWEVKVPTVPFTPPDEVSVAPEMVPDAVSVPPEMLLMAVMFLALMMELLLPGTVDARFTSALALYNAQSATFDISEALAMRLPL